MNTPNREQKKNRGGGGGGGGRGRAPPEKTTISLFITSQTAIWKRRGLIKDHWINGANVTPGEEENKNSKHDKKGESLDVVWKDGNVWRSWRSEDFLL